METSNENQVVLKKSISLRKLFNVTSIVVAFICFASCSSNDDPSPVSPNPPPPPPSVCKVQTQTSSGTGKESETVTYTYQCTFTYGYDEKGNQVSTNATYKYNYSDGKTATSSSSTSSQFDDSGFIIRSVMQYAGTNKDGVASSQNNTTQYEYSNDRLIKESHNYNNNGTIKNYSFSYEYDMNGKPVKVISTYDNSYTKYEWNGDKLFKMTRVDQFGNSESPYLEYNAQGWLVKSIETWGSQSDEMRYEYDAEGQYIRAERYINAKPSSAWTNEFDTKENPTSLVYGKFKGHPVLPRTQPEYAPKHNVVKSSLYNANASGAWELSSSTVYDHDYNGRNFPVEVIAKTLDKNGVQTSSSRTSYQYIDCQ